MTDIHAGGCLCGNARYWSADFFPEENVEFTAAAPATFEYRSDESGRWLRSKFCPRCGTAIVLAAERRPGQLAIAGGTFDDPEWFTIDRHIWTRSKLRWMRLPDGTPAS